ncbi:MAG: hypothetical protein CVU39_17845 [Chloroflexi bacterium HGW-Chloroflexi-10]|nr:MAG: hypothetical protein CVU39_17845 [Chloroflexi bacterium HGW-Chloroflexi-10]
MPGIVGFVKKIDQENGLEWIRKMGIALETEERFRRDMYTTGGFGIGRIHLGLTQTHPQPVWNPEHMLALVLEGEIFNRAELEHVLKNKGIEQSYSSDAELLLTLYEHLGSDFAPLINGAFVMVFWNLKTQTCTIINDRMGLYPIYYSQSPSGFHFASGIRALVIDPNLDRSPDQTAIAEFLTFDHMLGQRTLLKSVSLMPQGSILTVQDHNLSIQTYHHFQYHKEHELRNDSLYIEEFIYFMRQAVERQYQGNLPQGLLLSGGLDSRFILAFMMNIFSKNPLHTFTWSIPNSDDARYAKEIANQARTQHHFFELKPDWLLDLGEKAVRITSGNGNIVNLHALATLEQESQIANVIYKGFMGDAMFGFGVRPRFWADYDDETRMEVHMEAYRDYRVLTFDTPIHSEIFTDSFFNHTSESWRTDFRDGMNAAGIPQMTDQRSYFDLTQRVPRMTINGVEVARDRTLVRLPFTDNDLIDFSLRIPPYLRMGRALMNQAFIKQFPQYAKIPIAQTRLPMITCAREILGRNLQFVQWHMRNRGLTKLAGPETRPYKDYNNWFRTVLRSRVEETLLNSRALERGYLKPQALQKIVKDHMAGKNQTVRIGALMSIEIAHQLFVD